MSMNGISSAGMTTNGRIMSWSSCSRIDARLAEPIEVAAYFAMMARAERIPHAARDSLASPTGSRTDSNSLPSRCASEMSICEARECFAAFARASDTTEALGGSIRVSSRQGSGTQIAVELPVELE
jgi:hypothetical protein